MCTNMASFSSQDSSQYGLKRQIRKMESYLKGESVYFKNADKSDFLSLTGGEPTLHPDFFQLLAYFRRRLAGTPIRLLTNGRTLADTGFTAKLLKTAGPPFCFIIPLHGSGPSLHDKVAGVKGCFMQTMKGLENLFSMAGGRDIEIRVVLHKLNAVALPDILKLLLKKFPRTSRYRVVVIHYEIEGESERNHPLLALRFKNSVRAVRACVRLLPKFAHLELYHFPLCVLPPSLRALARVTLPRADRIYPPSKCGRCALKAKCLGLMRAYHKKFGASELKTI